jgi:hypothetical protein
MRTSKLLSTLFVVTILAGLLLPPAPESCSAADASKAAEKEEDVCTYCKGTDKVEVNCPKCRGTGLGKKICPECKGRKQAGQRCSHCKGRDLTKLKCTRCRGKDLTKEKCPKCKGKGKDKNSGKDCWDCNGTGRKLPCRYCKGTGKQEQCWYCKGTGKKGKCEACSGTGRKNKCTDCKGTGKTIIECKACRIARLTIPKKKVSFHAAALGDIVVAVGAGKTYVVNRSDKPVTVEPLVVAARDKDGKDLFTQEVALKEACAAQTVKDMENSLKSFEGVKKISVKQGGKTAEMKLYEKKADSLLEFLKKGKLEE